MTSTTLTAAMPANAVSFRVASASGAAVGGYAKVDNEYSTITAINGLVISVRGRGGEGGAAVAHDTLSSVVFLTGTEMPSLAPGDLVPAPTDDKGVIAVGQDGTIAWNTIRRDTVVTITKATAAAITLEAPSAAQDGVTLTIVSATAAAHIVTATGLYDDGVTGGAKSAATFAAFVGANMQVQANRGHWTVLSVKGVAVA